MVLVGFKPDLWRPTGFLQCFDTVGLVIWPVNIVPEMTYYVSSGMLNLHTHSLPRSSSYLKSKLTQCILSYISLLLLYIQYLIESWFADFVVFVQFWSQLCACYCWVMANSTYTQWTHCNIDETHDHNPLTLSLHSMGSPDPELPDTTLFVIVFFLEISKPTFQLYGYKPKTCRPVFRPYWNL